VASIGRVLGRRLLVLFAVLLGLTALVTSLAPRPTVRQPAQSETTPAPTATPAPERAAGGSRRIEETISANPGRARARVRARVGDVLALTVTGDDVLDGVEIPELGKLEPIEPGSPARFEMLLERRGELRVSLVDAERLIGLVVVSAAPA
jgi:hypothetical protein